ncbi:unnamed protein product [Acanthoscelides obtectus]|uniref:Uncharacterized protein n=1 Tax=Acanthoscelides obtectus TaxID=200917 RepID=A0A9P0KCN9_ACAOB|nr:unnamed protein product [Acanthoscelides obtectus]CAK1628098.1 hypothetical protein AOBTE_LOCUS5030 [Acanthoscelides obtectus]
MEIMIDIADLETLAFTKVLAQANCSWGSWSQNIQEMGLLYPLVVKICIRSSLIYASFRQMEQQGRN